jgi:flavin reductase (DIM6/NTAB) family NADH-FMN oxidoreductase RutF
MERAGSSTNLSPFSYFTLVNHDPPVFVIGFSGGFDRAKDSLRNLTETGECTNLPRLCYTRSFTLTPDR